MYPTRALLSAAAVLSVAAVAAPASQAATLTLDKACYVNLGSQQQPIVAAASGLEAGKTYNVGFSAKGKSETGYAYGPADASGVVTLPLNSWYGGSAYDVKTYDATVTLRDGQTVLATAETKTTSVGFQAKGKRGLRSWKVTGLAALTGGTTYYAHYFNHGKYKGRLKLGKASGPCGVFTGKRPLTPFKKIGRYEVKITTNKTFSKDDLPLTGRVVVTRY
ncbi:MAG: hypothetical protein PGN13_02670 [Patulibacter minatonensis]